MNSEARQSNFSRRQYEESLLNDSRLKCFAVEDTQVSSKDIPEDSELYKYATMIKGSSSKKMEKKKLPNAAQGSSKSRKRSDKRTTISANYAEEEVSSDDEFLHCDSCDAGHKGACPVHGPMIWVEDNKTPKNDPERAANSLPPFLSLGTSAIPKAGLGVWTEIALPQGFIFGPYRGKKVIKNEVAHESGYAWKVFKREKTLHYIEAKDKSSSNWMRYVNSAKRETEQNVFAFQYKKKIFYKTCKPIQPYTELLTWYGTSYAKELGLNNEDEDTTSSSSGDSDGDFACSRCDRIYTTASALEGHMRAHPHMTSDKRHRCIHCKYSTDDKGHLTAHMVVHSGEKPFECFECGQRFTVPGSLNVHLDNHGDQRPFVCSQCKKGFSLKKNLRRHERSHTGERPFKCPTCEVAFTTQGSLKVHEMTHLKQKPYSCPHCPHRCSQASTLRQHVTLIHTKDFKYVCSKCQKGFLKPSLLQKHMAKHLND